MDSYANIYEHIKKHQIAMRQMLDLERQIGVAIDQIKDTITAGGIIYTCSDDLCEYVAMQPCNKSKVTAQYCATIGQIKPEDLIIYYTINGNKPKGFKEHSNIISICGGSDGSLLEISIVSIVIKCEDPSIIIEMQTVINNMIWEEL